MGIPDKKNCSDRGFTLIELSIVLVIMGILVAVVIGGSDMLQTAKLRGVLTEVQKYKVAIDSFKETYNALPGDMTNAVDYFGDAGDCGNANRVDNPGTCNGNGDGRLSGSTAGDNTEPFTSWDQLALAKMISGHYSGGGTEAVIGVNCPRSGDYEGAGFSMRYYAAMTSWGVGGYEDALGRKFEGNFIMFGKTHGSRNDLNTSVVNPEDAYYIDSKMDDGTPDFGFVMAGNGSSNVGNCATGAAPDIVYNITNEGVSCNLIFHIGAGDSNY
ncbi:MAG: prepilin-type N-terminal cleavage/methylation domain-containing protein [Rickettsiales bacterium]|nr:prepilin-type N-terminal cleavage/methylation domain-containing protein [Pseudomonadota bacterium]MDA0967448.1 prepilin-type N-terminal cleavage/methylation domain-containing protein [Pseudomonadota bacterium]MDG4544184.1 prepilin-type N-terminal cleavage/methylation domain-containing protein [Rickettsiales bacterium]MDG4546365.1 prepilin-type N-terminal cleavage/methylation domain-containing protein [Rickettsiales bacterium]MDG4548508.1 prepilin-type N-terminal cleavage/methylation domain-c